MNPLKIPTHTVFVLLAVIALSSGVFGAIVPVYQITGDDATWTETANQGEYTVPTAAEDYDHEIWERPVEDNQWSDSAGTRTSSGKYYAYIDMKSAAWGIGTSDDEDYIFVKWEVVGAFQHEIGKDAESKLLEGHYYFYAEPVGKKAFAIETIGKDLIDSDDPSDFGDVAGKVKIHEELVEGNIPGTGIPITEEGTPSFGNSQVAGQGRADTSAGVVEVAVLLSDLGLTRSDFDVALDYAYTGIAISNPSADSDLFANDHFPELIGSGVEYDTIQMGTLIPEPATIFIMATVGVPMLLRRRRSRG